MAAIEAFREPENRRERPDGPAAFAAELAILLMPAFRRRLPVIPGHQRDDLDLLRIEAAQISILDQIVRMLVMALVADVDADVMQQGGIFEPFTLAVGEAVDDARLVEQGNREPRHLLRVLRPVVAPLGELEHAPSPYVRIPVGLRDLLPVAPDVVEDQTLAERQITERDVRRTEPAQNRVQQDAARDGKVGAPRLEARYSQPLLNITSNEHLL
jgi:hypothetical protein